MNGFQYYFMKGLELTEGTKLTEYERYNIATKYAQGMALCDLTDSFRVLTGALSSIPAELNKLNDRYSSTSLAYIAKDIENISKFFYKN